MQHERTNIMNKGLPDQARGSHNNELVLNAALKAVERTAGIRGYVTAIEPLIAQGRHADATIDLELDDQRLTYLVEVKHVNRIALLDQIKKQFDGATKPYLLVAPKISTAMAGHLRDFDMQYIDASGNAYLKAPGMFVLVKGETPGKDHELDTLLQEEARVSTGTALRLAFVLLCEPKMLNAPYRVLSHAAGVSLGAIGLILNDLEKRGLISGAKGSRRLVDRERLLREWVVTYPLSLRPKLKARRFSAANSNWWNNLDIGRYDAMWGGEMAADIMTSYLKPEKWTIYMHANQMRQNLSRLVMNNRLRADPDGDIEVLEAFWKPVINSDVQDDIVPSLLVYADLIATMEPRNLELAAAIHERLAHDE